MLCHIPYVRSYTASYLAAHTFLLFFTEIIQDLELFLNYLSDDAVTRA